MPLFIDIHRLSGEVTADMIADAHAADVKVQDTYGVCYRAYWYDQDARTVVCLAEGPNRQACETVHREAHGLVADQIIEVSPDKVEAFMGGGSVALTGAALLPDGAPDTGLRVLLFTEIDNLASVGTGHGDAAALRILEEHDRIVRETFPKHGGREVRHTGDGMMLSFASASAAVRWALDVQRACAAAATDDVEGPVLRIGLAAGEPVAQHESLFGVAVDQARAICRAARPGEILVSAVVRDLCAGKGLHFAPSTVVRVPGVAQPLELASVRAGAGEAPAGPRRAAPVDERQRVDAAVRTRYAVDREVGEGGMATVYLVRDLRHDRQVAMKVLRPELAAILGTDRFLQEIRFAARLTHPNIVALYDSGEADGVLYYVMPHLEGETLRETVERERQLPVERVIEITRTIAAALDHAHRQGVVHRDIKPENILLHEGQPMILDFGIAVALSQAGGERLTEPGMTLGTPAYMSPEQATGDRDIDARTDVYGLGCVVYEMLAGDPPFTGANVQALITSIISETPRRLSRVRRGVPRRVDQAVHKALAKVPADRFDSAGAFAAALTGK